MPKILQNHYVLAVHDVQKMAVFFIRLGFKISKIPRGRVFVEKDNCFVMLGDCPNTIAVKELGDHNYFGYLLVDDAESYYQELSVRGVEFISPLSDKAWGMREFCVKSPEGHRIMIGQSLSTDD